MTSKFTSAALIACALIGASASAFAAPAQAQQLPAASVAATGGIPLEQEASAPAARSGSTPLISAGSSVPTQLLCLLGNTFSFDPGVSCRIPM